MDESGAPGVAKSKEDYLAISLVIFDSREATEKYSDSIDRLRTRLKLPEGYEFHFSRNSKQPRDAFIKLISSMNFRIITVILKKNDFKQTASYSRLAEYLAREITSRFSRLRIEMDTNPILQKELKKHLKSADPRISIRPVRSTSSNLVQLADYVVALSTRKAKGSAKAIQQYRPLIKKHLYTGEHS